MNPPPNRRGWEKVPPVRKPVANPTVGSPTLSSPIIANSTINAPAIEIPFLIKSPDFSPWMIRSGFRWADYADEEVVLPSEIKEEEEEEEQEEEEKEIIDEEKELLIPETPRGLNAEQPVKEAKQTIEEPLLIPEKPLPPPARIKRSFKPRKTKRLVLLNHGESVIEGKAKEEISTVLQSNSQQTEESKPKEKVKGNGFIIPETPKLNRKAKRKELKLKKPVPVQTPMNPIKEVLFYKRSITLFRFTYPFQHLSTIEIRQCANLSKLGYIKLKTILSIMKEDNLRFEFSMAYKLFDFVSSVSNTDFYALMISCIDIIPKKRTDETKINFTKLIQKSKIQAVRNFDLARKDKKCTKEQMQKVQHAVETEFQLTKFAENMFMTPKKPSDLLYTQVGVFVPGNCKLHSCSMCYQMRHTRVQLCPKCKTGVCSDVCKQKALPSHKCLFDENVESEFQKHLMGSNNICLHCKISSTEQVRCRCILTIVLHQLMFLQENGYLYTGCLLIVAMVLEYTDIPPLWSKNLFTVWPKLLDSHKDTHLVEQILNRDKKFIQSCELATCGHCNSASYCSQECLTNDQQTHGPECSTIKNQAWPVLVDE